MRPRSLPSAHQGSRVEDSGGIEVNRKLAGLVEAIADHLRAPGLQGRLDTTSSSSEGIMPVRRKCSLKGYLPLMTVVSVSEW